MWILPRPRRSHFQLELELLLPDMGYWLQDTVYGMLAIYAHCICLYKFNEYTQWQREAAIPLLDIYMWQTPIYNRKRRRRLYFMLLSQPCVLHMRGIFRGVLGAMGNTAC